MIGVFIIPTGVGAEIGGHAGDATPAARLIAGCCDKLIIHPNVVNASDINEATDNMLCVEGSQLDKFLEGDVNLREVMSNKILVAVNKPAVPDTINAVSAAIATLGVEAEIIELRTPLVMRASFTERGAAHGEVAGAVQLVGQVKDPKYDFDALAIHTRIDVSREVSFDYLENGGVNPWGGVEAIASGIIAQELYKPVAHAPIENFTPEDQLTVFGTIHDPRLSAEMVSSCFLHCVLKGLHRAPRLVRPQTPGSLSVKDVSFLISPWGLYGEPHQLAIRNGIPLIYVRENQTIFNEKQPEGAISVNNYLEAAGLVMALRGGVNPKSLTRPLVLPVIHS